MFMVYIIGEDQRPLHHSECRLPLHIAVATASTHHCLWKAQQYRKNVTSAALPYVNLFSKIYYSFV